MLSKDELQGVFTGFATRYSSQREFSTDHPSVKPDVTEALTEVEEALAEVNVYFKFGFFDTTSLDAKDFGGQFAPKTTLDEWKYPVYTHYEIQAEGEFQANGGQQKFAIAQRVVVSQEEIDWELYDQDTSTTQKFDVILMNGHEIPMGDLPEFQKKIMLYAAQNQENKKQASPVTLNLTSGAKS